MKKLTIFNYFLIRKEDKFHELAKNVEMWSKTIGMTLKQVTYATEKEREWHLQGSVDDLEFELKVLCSTNVISNISVPCQILMFLFMWNFSIRYLPKRVL